MSQELNGGDRVQWNAPQGKTRDAVKRKLISSTEVVASLSE